MVLPPCQGLCLGHSAIVPQLWSKASLKRTVCESSWPSISGKRDSCQNHSRWMGSAAEGAPELEMGISRTPAVFHLSCISWSPLSHLHGVVLVLRSDGAFHQHLGAFSGRGQGEKESAAELQSQLLLGLKKNKFKDGNCMGWVAGLRGRRQCDSERALVFPSFP